MLHDSSAHSDAIDNRFEVQAEELLAGDHLRRRIVWSYRHWSLVIVSGGPQRHSIGSW
jgi:hypothetical protein